MRVTCNNALCPISFGDLVIYPRPEPVDARLPRYAEHLARDRPGRTRCRRASWTWPTPRRWRGCCAARRRIARPRGPRSTEIVYLGDTALSDGNAFHNLRTLTGWPGWASSAPRRTRRQMSRHGDRKGVYVANRWSALADFASAGCWPQGAALDARTAVIVDIDKTALGARGRNDSSIDRARVAAIEATLAEALGAGFDRERVPRRPTPRSTRPSTTPSPRTTRTNVAYICLMIERRAYRDSTSCWPRSTPAGWRAFRDFIAQVDAQRDRLPSDASQALHDDIYRRALARRPDAVQGVPPPRVPRDGRPHGAPARRRAAGPAAGGRDLHDARGAGVRPRGCAAAAACCWPLSDKPDEATMPIPGAGRRRATCPLHRTPTHIVGPVDRAICCPDKSSGLRARCAQLRVEMLRYLGRNRADSLSH